MSHAAPATAADHQQQRCHCEHPGLHTHTADQQQPQPQFTTVVTSARQQQEHQTGFAVTPDAEGLPIAAAVALPALLPLLWVDSAAAATVCLDVPDWLVDWRGTLFHSPVVAIGAAGLALVLFPKLIRVSRLANGETAVG